METDRAPWILEGQYNGKPHKSQSISIIITGSDVLHKPRKCGLNINSGEFYVRMCSTSNQSLG